MSSQPDFTKLESGSKRADANGRAEKGSKADGFFGVDPDKPRKWNLSEDADQWLEEHPDAPENDILQAVALNPHLLTFKTVAFKRLNEKESITKKDFEGAISARRADLKVAEREASAVQVLTTATGALDSLPPGTEVYSKGSKFFVWGNVSERWIALDRLLLLNCLLVGGHSQVEAQVSLNDAVLVRGVDGYVPLHYLPTRAPIKRGRKTFLNSSQCRVVEPHEEKHSGVWGEGFEALANVWNHMFIEDPQHLELFQAFLRYWYVGALKGTPNRGPGLTLVGPADAGKNFTVDGVLSILMGGDAADMKKILSKDGQRFASEVFSVPIGKYSDAPTSNRDARTLTEKVKEIIAEGTARYELKNIEPVTIPVDGFRLIIMRNDDDNSLKGLPFLEKNIEDKLVILPVRSGASEFPSNEELLECLPALGAWLRDTETRPEITDRRFGQKGYCPERIATQLKARQVPVGYEDMFHALRAKLSALTVSGRSNCSRLWAVDHGIREQRLVSPSGNDPGCFKFTPAALFAMLIDAAWLGQKETYRQMLINPTKVRYALDDFEATGLLQFLRKAKPSERLRPHGVGKRGNKVSCYVLDLLPVDEQKELLQLAAAGDVNIDDESPHDPLA